MNLSEDCIIKRDEIMFEYAFYNNIPILMILSGGYQKINAKVISDSIVNLQKKFEKIKKEFNSDAVDNSNLNNSNDSQL